MRERGAGDAAGGDFPGHDVVGRIHSDQRRADRVAAGGRHFIRTFQISGVVDDRAADRCQISADGAARELRGVNVDVEIFRMRDQRRGVGGVDRERARHLVVDERAAQTDQVDGDVGVRARWAVRPVNVEVADRARAPADLDRTLRAVDGDVDVRVRGVGERDRRVAEARRGRGRNFL